MTERKSPEFNHEKMSEEFANSLLAYLELKFNEYRSTANCDPRVVMAALAREVIIAGVTLMGNSMSLNADVALGIGTEALEKFVVINNELREQLKQGESGE